ncbi:uncharacterized protein NPIL_230901 [Nephila pilipes]|uniref:Uncharacterized protein n=1 Tax=Nephila pilipes TaxID=299642 RepID=A0A8X6NPD8_NEPPI|nr:uncharacterized protein NPIL_230901 [Nephila pilipes]
MLATCSCADDQITDNEVKPRAARNYDNYFDPESFNSDSEQSDNGIDFNEDGPVAHRDDRYIFPNSGKVYSPPAGYDKKPPAGIPDYAGLKGMPYGYPSWKGMPPPTVPDHADMALIMSLMNKQNEVQKKDEKGFLTSLTESNPVLVASIIPISIVLFSVAPVVIQYLKNNAPSMDNMVTTVASSKMARALTDKELLESTMENLVEFGRKAIEEDECVQETFCKQVISRAGRQNVKAVATVISRVSKEDWLKGLSAKELVSSLKNGECENACPKKATRRNR